MLLHQGQGHVYSTCSAGYQEIFWAGGLRREILYT